MKRRSFVGAAFFVGKNALTTEVTESTEEVTEKEEGLGILVEENCTVGQLYWWGWLSEWVMWMAEVCDVSEIVCQI